MKLNVSEVQDFMRCKYRWWAKWVMNRVPRVTATPLTVGKLIHSVFEDHLQNQTPMKDAVAARRSEFLNTMSTETNIKLIERGREALDVLDGLTEALEQWRDTFEMDYPVVEVETPFEWPDPEIKDLIWIGRPDRTSFHRGYVWHNQIKNLAAGVNFAVFTDLQQRSYHEHLYAEALTARYCGPSGFTLPDGEHFPPGALKYGGTLFTLVRKLKYRTNVTKNNPEGKVKNITEMFWQSPMAIDLDGDTHKHVMRSLRQHARSIREAQEEWYAFGTVPPPNENMNGGSFGNSPDEYFRVLTGDASLDDNRLFMDREDTYNKEVHNGEEEHAPLHGEGR